MREQMRKFIMMCAATFAFFGALLLCRAQGLGLNGLGGLGGAGSGETVSAVAVISGEPLVPEKDAEILIEVTVAKRYHIQSAYAPTPYIAARIKTKPVEGLTFGAVRFPMPK